MQMTNQAAAVPAVAEVKPHISAEALEWVGKAKLWLEQVKSAKPIANVDEHAQAVNARKTIGQAKRQVESKRTEAVAPYVAAQRSMNQFYGGITENIEAAIVIQDKRIQAFEQAERARQAEAERQARIAREAEAKRLREEADAKRREQEAIEARAQEEAAALEAAGRIDAADEVLNATIEQAREIVAEIEAVEVLADVVEHAPIAYSAPLATGGLRRTKRYSAKIADEKLIVAAWQRGELPSIAVQINQQYFDQQARSLKETMRIAGVELVVEEKIGG